MLLPLLAATALASAAPAPQTSDDGLTAALRGKDQALLDAIATGDRPIWDRILTPDAVYVDENGAVFDRTAYLESLVPLPKGVSGQLTIIDYSLRRFGDTALVVHRDDERETFHGVQLHAEYLMSETWLRLGGEWRLAMVHAYVVAEDPPAVSLPPWLLDSYVGSYRAGDDLVFVIQRQGDHLVAGRAGRAMQPLLAEAADLLFTPGQPRVKRLFQRDPGGRVTGFIDRREGEDIIWTKTP
jgi:hypothetical protein